MLYLNKQYNPCSVELWHHESWSVNSGQHNVVFN